MSIQQAYNSWAEQYDSNINRTRDLEGISLRAALQDIQADRCLEIGCGTGKNTRWFAQHCSHVTAVDFSEAMLAVAQANIADDHVKFIQADIHDEWSFADGLYDLVSFSLVLEHISDLKVVMKRASSVLKSGGRIYIGELHPFRQYNGSKARFETPSGVHTLECYTHHVSDFIAAAKSNHLVTDALYEHFDTDEPGTLPRILALIFRKP